MLNNKLNTPFLKYSVLSFFLGSTQGRLHSLLLVSSQVYGDLDTFFGQSCNVALEEMENEISGRSPAPCCNGEL